jgi:hypothetical protein
MNRGRSILDVANQIDFMVRDYNTLLDVLSEGRHVIKGKYLMVSNSILAQLGMNDFKDAVLAELSMRVEWKGGRPFKKSVRLFH